VTDTAAPPPLLAAFRGPVICRRTADALVLTGAAADSPGEILILTFIRPADAGPSGPLADAAVLALGGRRYRLGSASREWIVEAASVHLHRDVGEAFHRAVPPRPAPLGKRVFWRIVLALAATRAGKRLLLALRRRA
jgi:hypothetical protein